VFRPTIHFEQVPVAVVLKNAEEVQSNEYKPPKKQLPQNRRIENERSENARSEDGRIEARR
jgi:hypothetical protein